MRPSLAHTLNISSDDVDDDALGNGDSRRLDLAGHAGGRHDADLVCVAVQGVITERPWLVVLPLGATVMDEDHPVCCVWVKHPYSARIEIHNHAVGWNR